MTNATDTPLTYVPDRAVFRRRRGQPARPCQRHSGTSDARAAAEVLLAAYNGHVFHLAPHVLRSFNEERHRDATLAVIMRSAPGYADPHRVVPDATDGFRSGGMNRDTLCPEPLRGTENDRDNSPEFLGLIAAVRNGH